MEVRQIERVQTDVRTGKRLLRVLKALAEYYDNHVRNLLEGILLRVFEGRLPFNDASLGVIENLIDVYGLDLTANDSHGLLEKDH